MTGSRKREGCVREKVSLVGEEGEEGGGQRVGEQWKGGRVSGCVGAAALHEEAVQCWQHTHRSEGAVSIDKRSRAHSGDAAIISDSVSSLRPHQHSHTSHKGEDDVYSLCSSILCRTQTFFLKSL